MKSKIIFLVMAMLLITQMVSFAEVPELKIIVGEEVIVFPDAEPYINEDYRTMVPVRFVSEQLDAEVTWLPKTQEVKINTANKIIILKIDSNIINVNGRTVEMDTLVIIKDSRTFVPILFVSEVLEHEVLWEENTRTVTIIKPEPKEIVEEEPEPHNPPVYQPPKEVHADIEVFDKSLPENADRVDWNVSIDVRYDLDIQWQETEEFLLTQLSEATVNAIMTDVKTKTDRNIEIPRTVLQEVNLMIIYSSKPSNSLISISAGTL